MADPNQLWVTYAETDTEAWKSILLARSLNRNLTTRRIAIIASDSISKPLCFQLQEEFDQCHWIHQNGNPSKHHFRSETKLVLQKSPRWRSSIFLDCNCVALTNCDDLFHLNGVQFVQGKDKTEFVSVLTLPRTMSSTDKKATVEWVVNKENGKITDKASEAEAPLTHLQYCDVIDLASTGPLPLLGNELKLVCFANDHPVDYFLKKTFSPKGLLERDIFKYCATLVPDLVPRQNGTLHLHEPQQAEIPPELRNSVAIIGMGCRYPGANSLAEFWDLLEKGLEGVRKVPSWRWTKDNSFIRMDNIRATEAGFLSCPIDTFDPKFFNTSAADLAFLDPQQRLALRVVWEALEHAGIDPLGLKQSLTGVFGGWWRNDYKEMLQMQGFTDADFLRGYMGNALGPLTARISHFLDLMGPCYSTESGCSTSIAGVDMACENLRSERCNLGIAVGVNLLLHPFPLGAGAMEGLLAADGRCKTFDASADGFGRAEGVGVLVLKRFTDAVRDGDRIWGLIRSSAVVQEGPSKSMGTPTVEVEAAAMQLALERAGVDPDDVDFVEVHGTGTPVGDPIEVAAVAKAYSKRKGILTIGSVKTNIGHTESVCGIASIQKTVLSMFHEMIPKHLHLNQISPDIDLSSIPAQLPLAPIPWKRGGKARLAGINSFGITGAQAHLILQEPPSVLPKFRIKEREERPLKIFTVSAKSADAFKAQLQRYQNLLKENQDFDMNDVEYTMHTGRAHFQLRNFVTGSSREELLASLEGGLQPVSVPNVTPKVCFLFTGQGSQYAGMAQSLYESSFVFRTHFDWCDTILKQKYGITDMKTALWSDDESLIKKTLYSQTSIFIIEFCLLRLWESWGIKPAAVLGHSLGEFAAAVAAKILEPENALKLVVTRSKLIDSLPSSSMIVVNGSLKSVEEALDRCMEARKNGTGKKWLDIAAVNSENQIVLAGLTETVNAFKTFCENNNIKTHVLDSSHAFHSRLMEPMLEEYEVAAKKIQYHDSKPGCVFISGVEGKVISRVNAQYWIKHTRERVRFLDASFAAVKEVQAFTFLEVGPHPVLSTLLMNNVDEIADVDCFPSLRRKYESWDTMLTTLGKLYNLGIPINWKNYHRYSTQGKKLELPGYPFEETSYWMGIKDDGTAPFHPLLGGFVPNASETKIFNNNLHVNRIPFLKDHSLGDKVIFPCAGYLDMALTANYAASHCDEGTYVKPTAPISLKDFNIAVPVCLSEMSPTEFQVITSKTPEGDQTSSIYTKLFLEDKKYKWVRNATATSAQPSNMPNLKLEELQARCNKQIDDRYFDYRGLSEMGFNFGPSLQTMQTGWRNSSADQKEFLFQYSLNHIDQEDQDRFILHPWLIDSMLQSHLMAQRLFDEESKAQLSVPIQVESYSWWGKAATPTGFIYVKDHEAHVLDLEGNLVATMIGPEFMDTTIMNIMALIDSQRNPYPTLAEIVWKESLGPVERRVPAGDLGSINLQQYYEDSEHYNRFTPEEEEFFDISTKYLGLLTLRTMISLNLEQIQTEFTYTYAVEKLGIQSSHGKFFRYLLTLLVEDGWLQQLDEETFLIKKPFPPMSQVIAEMDRLQNDLRSNKKLGYEDIEISDKVLTNLDKILQGRIMSLSLLFPEGLNGNEKGPAEYCYSESVFAKKRKLLHFVEGSILSKLSAFGQKSVVRILEVGAGTGSATEPLIKYMMEAGPSHFEYTYTDVSPIFLEKGKKLFEDTGINARFELLNIEDDVFKQGFAYEHYDVIIASWVIHATPDIAETMLNLKKLLRPGGYVFITELTNPSRFVTTIFGTLDGFWRFSDTQLRPWHCQLPLDGWSKVLTQIGFTDYLGISIYNDTNALIVAKRTQQDLLVPPVLSKEKHDSWMIFGEKDEICRRVENQLMLCGYQAAVIPRKQISAEISEMETEVNALIQKAHQQNNLLGVIFLYGIQRKFSSSSNEKFSSYELCQTFLCVCKAMQRIPGCAMKLVTFTKGNLATGPADYSIEDPTPSPILGMAKVFANESQECQVKIVDLDPNPVYWHNSLKEACFELFDFDDDLTVAYRNGRRCVPRFHPYKVKNTALSIPKTSSYCLELPKSLMISDLKFVPLELDSPKADEVEIEVLSYSLNFRDVLVITKPDPLFNEIDSVGFDLSGVIVRLGSGCTTRKVGDRVVTMRQNGTALPSKVIVKESHTFLIPEEMSYNDAATLPAAIITVKTCLLEYGKAKAGDAVLIHTASGGVGLVAIQLAKKIGCTIIVTAGNERKRNFLRSLGIQHVFNSRTTNYGRQIRAALNGKGVDVVLNSITGPGFKEATLDACNPGARFIEMSKMNIFSNEDVKKLRPDVIYDIIDVSTMNEEELIRITGDFEESMKEQIVKPLPYVAFPASEIREAMNYMEKVKHVGKIVITMPKLPKSGDWTSPIFHENATYLITGGLGGIGLVVCEWMIQRGAKNLLLLGRREPSPDASERLQQFREQKVSVYTRQCDVGDFQSLEGIFKEFAYSVFPPIRGIIHSAGLIKDGSFADQTWDSYEAVMRPKILGSWNLHKLSLALKFPLEHFVVFSSLAASAGSYGQSNYVAGNQFMDSLIYFRHSRGLPATTINWGQWAQVGIAAKLVLSTFRPFTVQQGISALEHAMTSHRIQVNAYDVDVKHLKKILPSVRGIFADIDDSTSSCLLSDIDGNGFWTEYDAASSEQEKLDILKKFLKQLIRVSLKLDKNEEISEHSNFADMGMDSLMMVELKSGLQSTIGKRNVKISINSVRDCKTVAQLASRLIELISGVEEIPPPTLEELLAVTRKDAELPEEIQVTPELASTLTPLSQVSSVLLLGATGNLGVYLLKELVHDPKIKKVYCMIRPNPLVPHLERMTKILNEKGLLDQIPLDKVEFISGDIREPRFGMSPGTYSNLVSSVEAIVNSAAKIAFDEFYRGTEDPKSSRVVNVFGIKNILAFAVDQKLKYLYHASALAAETRVDEEDFCLEDWPTLDEIEKIPNSAYPVSKMICDVLLSQAVERGVPCKAFRFPHIGGESETHRNLAMDSFLMIRFMVYLNLGSMPESSIPFNILPVDQCAKFSLKLFFNEKTGYEMFNVYNPHAGDEADFDQLAAELGVQVEPIEPDDFIEQTKNRKDSDEITQLAKFGVTFEAHYHRLEDNEFPMYIAWIRGNKDIFRSKKMAKFLPELYPSSVPHSWELLRKYLTLAKEKGVFETFKIKASPTPLQKD